MNKEKEPEHLASIALSREEIASRQRAVGGARPPRVQHSGGASKALWALAGFALLISVALLIQLQQVKKQSDLQLQAITILQEKLINTGEQSDLSVDAIRVIVKDQSHEIRKLWDVANKRNKNNIEKNKERLDEQSKQVTKYTGKLDLINKDMSKQEKSILNKLSKNKEQLVASTKKLSSQMDKLKSNMGDLSKKSDKALKSLPKDLDKTLKDHSKGIKAMDATRLRLMKRINALDKELKALKKAKAAPAPAPVLVPAAP